MRQAGIWELSPVAAPVVVLASEACGNSVPVGLNRRVECERQSGRLLKPAYGNRALNFLTDKLSDAASNAFAQIARQLLADQICHKGAQGIFIQQLRTELFHLSRQGFRNLMAHSVCKLIN